MEIHHVTVLLHVQPEIALNACANHQKRAGGWMPPATMLQRNPNEFEDLDDMERVRKFSHILIGLALQRTAVAVAVLG